MKLKLRYILAIGILGIILGAILFTSNNTLGQGSGTITQLNPWRAVGGYIKTASSTAGLQVTGLANCNTIDTNGNGIFSCGTDDGGAGSQTPWTSAINGGGYALTNAGAITGTVFTSTSTTANVFPNASSTNLSVSGVITGTASGNDILGQATSTLLSHTTTYNHANYDTAYSWGNHSLLGYLNTAGVNSYIHSSTTIPKTYTANTFTGLQTFSNSTSTLISGTSAWYTNFYGSFIGNVTGTASGNLISGGTLTSASHCRWDGTGIDCDRVEDATGECGTNAVCMGGHTHAGVNEVYSSGWNGDVDTPEKDDVYDWGVTFDTDSDGFVNVVDTTYGVLMAGNTGILTASNTPTVNAITATSTTATSSLPWLTSARLAVTEIFQVLTNLIVCQSTTCTYSGTHNMSGATVKQHTYPSFTYASSTAFVGTSTVAIGVARNAQAWNTISCFTDVGTVDVYITDGTNRMNWFQASTTAGTITLSINNTFTTGEKRYFEAGNPQTSPKSLSCSSDITINN
jgi:hypothetical protein